MHRMRAYYKAIGFVALFCCQMSASPNFLPQVKLAVGRMPYGVATGDYNGDGKADIAVAHFSGKIVNVILNNGDGTFQSAVDYAVGGRPQSVAVADLNGDGKLDLIVGEAIGRVPDQYLNTIGILLGNGDGSFQADISYPEGRHAMAVIAGDLNGDSKPDVVAANHGGGGPSSLVTLLGNGDGSFQIPGITDTKRVTLPSGVAAGDFNGDGRLDIATSNANGTAAVAVRLGKGDGAFRAPIILDTHNDAATVAVGDLNGDGNLDVVSYTYTTFTLSVFLGDGRGKFQPAKNYPPHGFIGSIAIGDFDGDGKADLAVVEGGIELNSVGILPGRGDGTFGKEQDYAVGDYPTGVAIGDFNGDGLPDLVVTNRDEGTVSVLLNTRDNQP